MNANQRRWQIAFYQDRRGFSQPLEYINGLAPKEQAKVYYVFRLLEEFGFALGMPHARRIDGDLWELRPGDNRLFYCAYTNNQFVVLHGFRKATNRTPEKHIRLALRRMKELLEE